LRSAFEAQVFGKFKYKFEEERRKKPKLKIIQKNTKKITRTKIQKKEKDK